ncbi:MAG TPA: hypothetical protein VEI95_16180, partial [Acidobacteriota bacterium]|nr:hypothetical protein [Acidobacteriota bacterium]
MNNRIALVLGMFICSTFANLADTAELITLRYGQNTASTGSLSALPLTVAERKGFFLREGLKVEVVPIAGGTDRI